jgi:sulfoxide reductase heme-binding subunit YedZ
MAMLDSPRVAFEVSLATAFVGLALLAVTLLLGPWNVLRGRPNPVSTHLRRDVGIWAALIGFVHIAAGLQSHFRGEWLRFFLILDESGAFQRVRTNLFGVASWSGLGATALLVVLLALSNDLSLRRLGSARWKAWQRWNYVVFPAVVLHGLAFQVVEKRTWPWVALQLGIAALVVVGQGLGVRRRRGRS